MVDDIDAHRNPISDRVLRLEQFLNENRPNLSSEQIRNIQDLISQLRDKYADLQKKSGLELQNAETNLAQLISDRKEMVRVILFIKPYF